MIDSHEVNPDLMRAPGLGLSFDQRKSFAELIILARPEPRPICLRFAKLAACARLGRPAAEVAARAADGPRDGTEFLFELAPDESQVSLGHGPVLELLLEAQISFLCLGHDESSGSLAVQTMDDAGAFQL